MAIEKSVISKFIDEFTMISILTQSQNSLTGSEDMYFLANIK